MLKRLHLAIIVCATVILPCSSAQAASEIEYLAVIPKLRPKTDDTLTRADLMVSAVLNSPSETITSQHKVVRDTRTLSPIKARLAASGRHEILVHGVVPVTEKPLTARYAIGGRNKPTHHELLIAFSVAKKPRPILNLSASLQQDVPGEAASGITGQSLGHPTDSLFEQETLSPRTIYLFSGPNFSVFVVVEEKD
ncbi:MAG: hypothetical protein EBT18_02890 [Gammaproteobacteria bacterium]|nr:hypothetical protein [Gammaproteobacteria bacterium]